MIFVGFRVEDAEWGVCTGVEMLNGAMEKLYRGSQPDQWAAVSVSVAPSTITITDREQQEIVHAECRVRYLSFMSIALRNDKLFGFIMHTAQNQYVAHVFFTEPSAGALSKTIQAACKVSLVFAVYHALFELA
jgi:amyloid beta (A4) precursor protein-binding family B protein 2 (Fe65-like)